MWAEKVPELVKCQKFTPALELKLHTEESTGIGDKG